MVLMKRVASDMPKCSGAAWAPKKNDIMLLKGKITPTYNAKETVLTPELREALLKAICDLAQKSNQLYCPQKTFPCPMPKIQTDHPFYRWRPEPPVILHWDCVPWHRCCPASNTTEAFFSFLERLKRIFPSISAGEAMGMWTYIEKRDHCECHYKPLIELCKKDSSPKFLLANVRATL